MRDDNLTLSVPINSDLGAFRRDLDDITKSAKAFGSAISSALEGAIVKGKSFSEVMKGLALRLSSIAVNAAMKPLENLIGNSIQSLVSNISPFAKGGAFQNGRVLPFARGGVVAAPTYFPMSGGDTGLMGEAGAEAIMPLRRGPDGRLGVAANGAAAPVVTVNIAAADAPSFLKAEGQVAAALARAVARGQRNL